jgi:catechol 2,3-dioxygenase-like lactoylglutathione lyase family enzyme
MFKHTTAFSGFSVSDLAAAKEFYSGTLGLGVEEGPMGLRLKIVGSNDIFIYQKDDHTPATYTMLNFVVDDIEQAVKELTDKGVILEHYDGMTDETGIARGIAAGRGPDIAWFKDPAGNILSVLHDA